MWDRLETWRGERYIDDWATQHELNAEDRESLRRLVARAVYDASFRIVSLMDSGENDSMPGFPGWWLVEVESDGNFTGREVAAIHESLMTSDPTGNQAADFR